MASDVAMSRLRWQRGAVLVEFSLIFVAMLVLFYGIIVYSIVFVTQQAVAFAAESGADAVVAVDPQAPNFILLANTVATAEVNRILGFLPGTADTVAVDTTLTDNPDNPGREIRVTVNYNFRNWSFPLTGLIPLPGVMTGVGLVNTQNQQAPAT